MTPGKVGLVSQFADGIDRCIGPCDFPEAGLGRNELRGCHNSGGHLAVALRGQFVSMLGHSREAPWNRAVG